MIIFQSTLDRVRYLVNTLGGTITFMIPSRAAREVLVRRRALNRAEHTLPLAFLSTLVC